MKATTNNFSAAKFDDWLYSMHHAVYKVHLAYTRADYLKHITVNPHRSEYDQSDEQYHGRVCWMNRPWRLHPAVRAAMDIMQPKSWQTIALEWPHTSEYDSSKLAYSKDWKAWSDNKQLRLSVGKYLTRHFDLPDHIVRDLVAQFAAPYTFEILTDLQDMIDATNDGPNSCMRWSYETRDDGRRYYHNHGTYHHPYEAYDPKYGWALAIRKEGNSINGRCLVNTDRDGTKVYVRSFKRCENGGYSYSDNALESWLNSQGYNKYDGWECFDMAKVDYRGEFLAPYLDGDCQRVTDRGDYLTIDSDGEYEFDRTDGMPSAQQEVCECCGDHYDEEQMNTTYDGSRVCDGCLNEDYRYAIVRNGYHEWVHYSNTVYVEEVDDYYHDDLNGRDFTYCDSREEYIVMDNSVEINGRTYHVDDDDIVQDAEGEYQLLDDCVLCEDGEYRLSDECVQCADGEWRESDDCVQCADGEWREESECKQTPDGEWYEEHELRECSDGEWRLPADTYYDIELDEYHAVDLLTPAILSDISGREQIAQINAAFAAASAALGEQA